MHPSPTPPTSSSATTGGGSGLAATERYPIFPVFVLIDTSSSMTGEPIDAVNHTLPELKQLVAEDPTVGEIARIAIIIFATDATTALPLSDLAYTQLPHLDAGGSTNFAAAFDTTRHQIETSIRALGKGTRFHTPVIFFLSDGHPTTGGDWTASLQTLTDPAWMFRAEIVAFGFGDTRPDTLTRIATRHALLANDAPPAEQAKDIMHTIIGSIRTTSGSLHSNNSGDGGLIVDADPTKFTPLPVHHL